MPISTAASRLIEAKREAASCQRCPLYKVGTQTVFGAGPADAAVVVVGEQPGDVEDRQGLPFVGPAGRELDRAIAAAGLRRERMYVTNAVKHFKNIPRGKRRIHQKPNAGEIERCKWWLDLELEIIKPGLAVALGVTAARALAGRPVRIAEMRGMTLSTPGGLPMLVTIHPSLILRLPDHESRSAERNRLAFDLRRIGELVPDVRL